MVRLLPYNNYLSNPKEASKPNLGQPATMFTITDGTSNTVLIGHGNINVSQYNSSANVTLCTNIFTGGTTGTMRAGNDGDSAPGGVTLSAAIPPATPPSAAKADPSTSASQGHGRRHAVFGFPYTTNNFSSFLTPSGNEDVRPPF